MGDVMVSVIMSTYKEKIDYISGAVSSVLQQTYSDIELIIIVDDPTNHEAIDYIRKVSSQDSRVRMHINSKNQGLVSSLNHALEMAGGEYIARMDADDYSHPDRIEKQMQQMTGSQYDLIGCFTEYIDMSGNKTGSGFQDNLVTDNLYALLQQENCIPHPTWLVKKSLYDQLHGYRQIPYSEDYDFILRAIKQGASLFVLNEPLVDYRINEEGISLKNSFRQTLVTRFLSYNRNRIEEIGPDDIQRLIEKRDNKAARRRFESGMKKLKEASCDIAHKKYITGSLKLVYSFSISSASRYRAKNLLKKHMSIWE